MAGSSFRYNGYAYVGDVEVDFQIDSDGALEDIGEEYVREWLWVRSGEPKQEEVPNRWFEDPVKRLEVILWLRSNGYVVEGGGPA